MSHPKWLNWLFGRKQSISDRICTFIMIVERLKHAVDSPEATAITKIIPGSWDDRVVEQLRVIFSSVLRKMKIVQSIDLSIQPFQAVRTLKPMDNISRNKQYKSIATNMVLLDGLVSSKEAAGILVENEYQLYKQSK